MDGGSIAGELGIPLGFQENILLFHHTAPSSVADRLNAPISPVERK
jgi:hypothetical protein